MLAEPEERIILMIIVDNNKNKKLIEMALIGKCDNNKVEVYTDHQPIHIHWKGCKIDVSDSNNVKVLDGILSQRDLNIFKNWLNDNCSRKNMNKLTYFIYNDKNFSFL